MSGHEIVETLSQLVLPRSSLLRTIMSAPLITLNDGNKIPALGLGWSTPGDTIIYHAD